MRIAAFGDIHSNHIALEACMAEVGRIGVDGIAFLGDYVSDCACPQKTLSLLREISGQHRCWFVRGNREEYMLEYDSGMNGWKGNSQSDSLLYTYENLKGEDLDWFRSLPIYRTVENDGMPPFEMCHGAPWQTRVMLLPGSSYEDDALAQMQTELMLSAHTHVAFVLERGGKTIVNGGTLGLPTQGRTGASFAIIECMNGGWIPKLMNVEYDVEAVIREFEESGFMERGHVWARAIAAQLRTGREYPAECRRLVDAYSKETGIPFDDERLWLRAANALGL